MIEWNRDNTHEHPAFRYLPDGDLSGLVLSYQETRPNCIPMDSNLFATVDWPSLRVLGRTIKHYYVPLMNYATPQLPETISARMRISLFPAHWRLGRFRWARLSGEQYTYQFDSIAPYFGSTRFKPSRMRLTLDQFRR